MDVPELLGDRSLSCANRRAPVSGGYVRMTPLRKSIKNVPASINQRLLNLQFYRPISSQLDPTPELKDDTCMDIRGGVHRYVLLLVSHSSTNNNSALPCSNPDAAMGPSISPSTGILSPTVTAFNVGCRLTSFTNSKSA